MKNKLSKKEFNLLAKDGRKVVPFFKRIMADTITPTAAWANLSMHSDYGFILESVEKAKKNGRYSYVGINPSRIFEYDQRSLFEVINGKRKKINAFIFFRLPLITSNKDLWSYSKILDGFMPT